MASIREVDVKQWQLYVPRILILNKMLLRLEDLLTGFVYFPD